MHDGRLATDGGFSPSWARRTATLLALTFILCAGLLVVTSSGQVYAAGAVVHGARVAVPAVTALASAVDTALSGKPDANTLAGTVTYYGNDRVYSGSRDGVGADSHRTRTTSAKPGRRKGVVGILGMVGNLVIGWDFGATAPDYADAPAPPPNPADVPGLANLGYVAWNTGTSPMTLNYSYSSSTTYQNARLQIITYARDSNGNCLAAAPVGAPSGVCASSRTAQRTLPGSGTMLTHSSGYTAAKPTSGYIVAACVLPTSSGACMSAETLQEVDCTAVLAVHNVGGVSPHAIPANSVCPALVPEAPPPGQGAGSTPVTTTTTSRCQGAGGPYTTAPSSVTYTRAGGVPPAITIPGCNPGDRRIGVDQTSTTPDGRTVADPLGDLDTPIVPDAYPECINATCVLDLVTLIPGFAGSPDSDVQSCSGNLACEPLLDPQLTPRVGSTVQVQRATDPAGQTVPEQRPRTSVGREVECRYGPYRVPVDECVDVPIGRPVPPTGPPDPQVDDPRDSNCNLSDFSLNPVSWVVVPLKCLFIPRDSAVQGAASAIGDAWDGTAPATVVGAFGDVFAPVVQLKDDTAESCEGPPFTFPALAGVTDPFTIHPLSTCNELTAYLLGIWMPLSTAFVYLGGFFAGTRLILKTFGAESPVQA